MEFRHTAGLEGISYGTVLAGNYNEPDTYLTKRPEGRGDWLITFTLGGEGYFVTPGGRSVCSAGDVTLLKPGTPHQYGTSKDQTWQFVWAHFPAELAESSLLLEEGLLIQHMDNESARKRIYAAFQRILADSREHGDYWYELCAGALREILMLLAQKKNRIVDSRVEEVLHLLSKHMKEPIRIEDIAETVGLSPSRLSHLFKSVTGRSIIDTLNRMRVGQAALLLEHTDRSAAEVCSDVGFQNYNHFMNQFRKWVGVNPSVFKKGQRL